jgi:hypothetical protein
MSRRRSPSAHTTTTAPVAYAPPTASEAALAAAADALWASVGSRDYGNRDWAAQALAVAAAAGLVGPAMLAAAEAALRQRLAEASAAWAEAAQAGRIAADRRERVWASLPLVADLLGRPDLTAHHLPAIGIHAGEISPEAVDAAASEEDLAILIASQIEATEASAEASAEAWRRADQAISYKRMAYQQQAAEAAADLAAEMHGGRCPISGRSF